MHLEQQVGDKFGPGAEGGLAGPLAFNDGKVFAASRNDCFEIRARILDIEDDEHEDDELPAFIYATDISQPQNSNIQAIDTSTGNILWNLDLPNIRWGAGVTVSAGVIYALDFTGILHMINSDTGEEIDRIDFGGSGTAGVSIASAANGEMMVFIVTGGDETLVPTDGIITAFALREDGGAQSFSPLITYASIAVAAISISFAIFLLVRKS
jgi:outer membrane protein assembly factor BamB